MSENKEKLLQKIKQLALHGYGGEKANAQELLQRLMKKYNISESDLNDDPIVTWTYKEPNKKSDKFLNKLFWQLLVLTVESLKIDKNDARMYREKGSITFKTPLSFKLEFTTVYEFYSLNFTKDLDVFYLAFLKKNNLLIERKDTDAKPTQKDIEEHMDADLMSMGLRKHELRKQISGSGD